MTSQRPRQRAPVVLIVDHQEWSTRSLESILSPNGYAVMRAYTSAAGRERARSQPPDLVFIAQTLPDGSGVDLCLTLRADPELGPSVPIIVMSAGRPTRAQRLAALEAGAWEFLTHPIDIRELLLKLDAFTQAKLEVNRIRQQSLTDEMTGLYSLSGLEQRARELGALARRQGQALACVVFAPSLASDEVAGSGTDEEATTEAVRRLASGLRTAGRMSDSIGRSGKTEFAILAPNTDAEGAVKLAQRFASVLRATDDEPPLQLRVGFDAVANVRDAPAAARELLSHATIALTTAKRGGDGDWIQRFESSTTSS